MISNMTQLSSTIETVHKLMKTARTRLKCAATLRNLTELRQVIQNETRRSGKHQTLKRFCEIREKLAEACDTEEFNLPDTSCPIFANRISRFELILGSINVVTVELQKRDDTLSQCRDALDGLIEGVDEERNVRAAPFSGCRLGTEYIATNAAIIQNADFESGVVKIQRGGANQLSLDEKFAVRMLRGRSDTSTNQAATSFTSVHERFTKRRKSVEQNAYIKCSFILGCVAEAERKWIVPKYVLTEHRRSFTLQMFEALAFLRYNERFWDIHTVAEALNSLSGAS